MNMKMLSSWDDQSLPAYSGVYYSDIWGYVDNSGGEYAIMASVDYTHFIDVTNPESPVEISRQVGVSRCLWRDYKTYEHYAYGVSDNCRGGLQIFDLQHLPDRVEKVYESTSLFADAHNIFIDEQHGRLYVSGYSDVNSVDVLVLDLNDDPVGGFGPQNPKLLKKVDLVPGYVHDLYVRDDIVYCSHGNNQSLYIYDFSDLDNISVLGSLSSYTGQGYNHSSWLSADGKTLVMADETHNLPLKVVDVSDPDNIEVKSTFKSALLGPRYRNSVPHNPFIIGNEFAVVSYYHDGVQIYKIDDISQPFRVGYYDTFTAHSTYTGYKGCWGVYPFLPSGNIIASDIENGLFVLRPDFPLRNCDEEVVLGGEYYGDWTFQAGQRIISSALHHPGASVHFEASESIVLGERFEVLQGSELEIVISDVCSK
jgi:choice-of-anchor B domain-containing protein